MPFEKLLAFMGKRRRWVFQRGHIEFTAGGGVLRSLRSSADLQDSRRYEAQPDPEQ